MNTTQRLLLGGFLLFAATLPIQGLVSAQQPVGSGLAQKSQTQLYPVPAPQPQPPSPPPSSNAHRRGHHSHHGHSHGHHHSHSYGHHQGHQHLLPWRPPTSFWSVSPWGSSSAFYGYRTTYPGYGWPYYLDIGGSRMGPYHYPPAFRGYGPVPYAGPVFSTPVPSAPLPFTPPSSNTPATGSGAASSGASSARPSQLPSVRQSNAATKSLAYKNSAIGDQNFQKQLYLRAFSNYKTATRVAPDTAEIYFREAHTLAALGRYSMAVQTYLRAVNLDRRAASPSFTLNELYQGNDDEKQAHYDALDAALEKEPKNADLLFALGAMLYFDQQPEAGTPYLQQANELMLLEHRVPATHFLSGLREQTVLSPESER